MQHIHGLSLHARLLGGGALAAEGMAHHRQLRATSVSSNDLRGSVPDALAQATWLQELEGSNNHFEGALPEGLCSLLALEALAFVENTLRGCIPEAIGLVLSLVDLQLKKNELSGSLPDGLAFLTMLSRADMSRNRISGSLPDRLGELQSLKTLDIGAGKRGRLRGTLPESFGSLPSLEVLVLSTHQLHSTIPGSIQQLTSMKDLRLDFNKLAGTLPSSLACMQALQLLGFSKNRFEGLLPDAISSWRKLSRVRVADNGFSGAIPIAFSFTTSLVELDVSMNKLIGPLMPDVLLAIFRKYEKFQANWNSFEGRVPDGLATMSRLATFLVLGNQLEGALPQSLGALRQIRSFAVSSNKLSGSIPDSVSTWRRLWRFAKFDDNALAGSLPSIIRTWSQLNNLNCGNNLMEGALPGCLAAFASLQTFGFAGKEKMPQLRGIIPAGLRRAKVLARLFMQGQSLVGTIPSFRSSLRIFAIHHNSLELLPHLRVGPESQLLVHCNRLSCQLPRRESSTVAMALVGMGNHLQMPPKPGAFPAWVLPFERDGLFWIDNSDVMWLALKVLGGCGMLMLSIKWHGGLWVVAAIAERWQYASERHDLLARQSKRLLTCMVADAVSGCLLLMVLADCDYYACPALLAKASACLSRSSLVRIIVVLRWGSQLIWTLDWTGTRGRGRSLCLFTDDTCRHGLTWLIWALLVVLLSCVAMVDAANMCVPGIMAMGRVHVRVIHWIVGGCQGLLTGVVIPSMANKALNVRKPLLVSLACLLNTFLIPGLVLFYLDRTCLGHWTQLWAPCSQTGLFTISDTIADMHTVTRFIVMHHDEVCAPNRQLSLAECARSIFMKMQDTILNKLVMAALVLPAARIAAKRFYVDTDKFVAKLALFSKLAVLLAAPLPLLAPLLGLGVLSESLVAAISWHTRSMIVKSEEGDLAVAMAIVWICSTQVYACFVSEDALSMALLSAIVVVALLSACGSPHQLRSSLNSSSWMHWDPDAPLRTLSDVTDQAMPSASLTTGRNRANERTS